MEIKDITEDIMNEYCYKKFMDIYYYDKDEKTKESVGGRFIKDLKNNKITPIVRGYKTFIYYIPVGTEHFKEEIVEEINSGNWVVPKRRNKNKDKTPKKAKQQIANKENIPKQQIANKENIPKQQIANKENIPKQQIANKENIKETEFIEEIVEEKNNSIEAKNEIIDEILETPMRSKQIANSEMDDYYYELSTDDDEDLTNAPKLAVGKMNGNQFRLWKTLKEILEKFNDIRDAPSELDELVNRTYLWTSRKWNNSAEKLKTNYFDLLLE